MQQSLLAIFIFEFYFLFFYTKPNCNIWRFHHCTDSLVIFYSVQFLAIPGMSMFLTLIGNWVFLEFWGVLGVFLFMCICGCDVCLPCVHLWPSGNICVICVSVDIWTLWICAMWSHILSCEACEAVKQWCAVVLLGYWPFWPFWLCICLM